MGIDPFRSISEGLKLSVRPHMGSMYAGLKVVKAFTSKIGNGLALTLRFWDKNYGVHRFHKGRTVRLTGVARLGYTSRYLCFEARVAYC